MIDYNGYIQCKICKVLYTDEKNKSSIKRLGVCLTCQTK